MNTVGWVILFFIVADYWVHLLADGLNLKAMTDTIPPAFETIYDPGKYRQSQDYLRTQTRFGRTVATADLMVLLVFWLGGGFAMLDGWTQGLGWGPLATGLVYIGAVVGMKTLFDQPFSIYATFVIEERFGFNRSTPATWIKDRLKGLGLAIALGGPLLLGILAFFQYAGDTAWLWCWLLVTLFGLAVQFVAPAWIMPLFNRFEPLEEGPLKSSIMDYARSIGFSLDNVQVMDGSRRSAKSNAFFTGFGRHRRIVLFDTLIDSHTTDELVAVLAHEMGHCKLRHILKMMAAGVLQTGVLLYLMSLVIGSPQLSAAFYVPEPATHSGLIFFGLLYAPVDFLLGLASQSISRRHEYAADRFAATTTGHPRSLIDALKKLSVHNLSNLSPHPWYVFLNYSHPPVLARIAALEEIGKDRG
ncbi:peptidase M48 [Desulfosarcina ovata subsp. sediminis]|uniref:Peptidase M48 n=1 Tax=Desulfosarcina ovata subsp. sediminis TaxID=885957 RepID=A0A5K7ZKF9_9BACT|nr:peptidase M48 [Desulfosarcina ovata subsp. sediminis]